MILELSSKSHASLICQRCGSKIEFRDEAATCDRCGSSSDLDISAVLFLRIDDGSGQLDAMVESPESNILLGQDSKWIRRNLVEKKAPRIQLTVETLSRLIGTKVTVRGILTKDSNENRALFRVKELWEEASRPEKLFASEIL